MYLTYLYFSLFLLLEYISFNSIQNEQISNVNLSINVVTFILYIYIYSFVIQYINYLNVFLKFRKIIHIIIIDQCVLFFVDRHYITFDKQIMKNVFDLFQSAENFDNSSYITYTY